ncbi:MAG TPA: hypothetical protein VGK36_01425 [Candidatus Angelobacter sp.]
MALVLCTGIDRTVLETRRLILEDAGHKVVTVADEPSLADACQKNSFDVAVIGQTISPKMKSRVAMLVKQHCTGVKILELYETYTGKLLEDADSWLLVPAQVPQALLERVNELASKEESKRRKP